MLDSAGITLLAAEKRAACRISACRICVCRAAADYACRISHSNWTHDILALRHVNCTHLWKSITHNEFADILITSKTLAIVISFLYVYYNGIIIVLATNILFILRLDRRRCHIFCKMYHELFVFDHVWAQ